MSRIRFVAGGSMFSLLLVLLPVGTVFPSDEETAYSQDKAPEVATEDTDLRTQIVKIDQALEDLHTQMAHRRKAIQLEIDPAKKTALYSELDEMRKNRDTLEQILHELVEEAKATEWTKIDEALKRSRKFEQYQEKAYRREEAIRERQK